MKKLTIWIISSSWILYVLVPIIYRFVYGKYPENLQSVGYVPDAYMTKAAIIISVVLFVSALIIFCIPVTNRPFIETINCNVSYYYITLTLFLILGFLAGITNFNNVITGGMSGSFFSYYSMFFYPIVLFLIYLFCVKNKGSVLMLVGSYLVVTLLSHSRAGAVDVGLYLIGFAFASDILTLKKIKKRISIIHKKYNKLIKRMVIVLIIAAPLIFIYSTKSRGSAAYNNEHGAMEIIAARCSCLDEAGLAMYTCEAGGYPETVFLEKYGVIHQIKCIIDASIPGSLFEGDVDPNQYYRVIVGYMSSADAAKYYTSTNLMLPVYMVIKYGLFAGILFSIMLIVFFYLIVSKMKNSVWQVALISIVLKEIIYFFDWVMVWKVFLKVALTIVVFMLVTQHVHIKKM